MPTERRYPSNAERQKAYRERKAREEREQEQEVEEVVPAQPQDRSSPPQFEVEVEREWQPEAENPIFSSHPDLDAYVAEALLGAEIAFSQTSPNANMSTKTLGETLERAEAYARWRYQGVLDGEINGL